MEAKIRQCQSELTKWAREQNQNSAQAIKEAQEALEGAISCDTPDTDAIGQYTTILEQAYRDEEIFWKQRSRVAWLSSGDLNSYFHVITRDKRTADRFTVLENKAGTAFSKNKTLQE